MVKWDFNIHAFFYYGGVGKFLSNQARNVFKSEGIYIWNQYS